MVKNRIELKKYEYYKTDLGVLYHGDCLEIMPMLEPVDLVLTDPPYGTTACSWDSVIPLDKMWEQLKRIIKPNGAIVMTASQPFTSALVMSNTKMFKYCWVWEKSKGSNFQHSKYQPLKVHEDIVVFSLMPAAQNSAKRNMAYYPQMNPGKEYIGFNNPIGKIETMSMGNTITSKTVKGLLRYPRSVQYFKTAEKDGRCHPTQKPVALMEYLIKTYTNEGETVLDFCIGSGTTSITCERLNRRWIGIEKEEKYCEIVTKRIKKEVRRPSISKLIRKETKQLKLSDLDKK